jgi:hypothetical protein
MIEYMDTKRRSKSTHHGRGNLILGGPEYRDTTNMTDNEKRDYRKTRNDYTDKLRLARMRQDVEETLPSDTFTGCRTPHLRTEAEVESAGLEVGHTFPAKDLLLMCIAEEANL